MSFTLEKEDPSLFNILPIKWEEEPVTSLSTINLNFENLDTEICNISFSADNFWNSMYNDYVANSGKWESMYTTIQTYSACWQSTYTTVLETSAAWLSPISVVYPAPVSSIIHPAILQWVEAAFPVKTGSCVNYLNGQVLNVFVLEYTVGLQKQTVRCGTRNSGIVSKRCPGGEVIKIDSGCECRAETIKINDRYTRAVRGLKYVVSEFDWTYVGSIS
jgi:hypothetical protein